MPARTLFPVILGFVAFTGDTLSVNAASVTVNSVRIGDYALKSRFVLDLSNNVPFTVFSLPDPYRVVINLPEVNWAFDPGDVSIGRRITGFRFGLFRAGQSRVVIDLRRPVVVDKAFILAPNRNRGYRLVVDLADTTRSAFLQLVKRSKQKRFFVKKQSSQVKLTPPKLKINSLPLIAIDPGHGGVDPGARGRLGTLEKTLTLKQARELKRQLLRTRRYRVILTRNRDVFIRLRDRIAIAQRAKADLFLSLHADSIANRNVRGGSVYTLSEKASDKEAAALAKKENKSDIIAGIDLNDQSKTVAKILIDLRQRLTKNESVALAKGLIKALGRTTRLLRNNHRFAGFAVLKAPEIPSVLIELGYLSNKRDEKLLRNPRHRSKVAAAIIRALNSYFLQHQAQRQP